MLGSVCKNSAIKKATNCVKTMLLAMKSKVSLLLHFEQHAKLRRQTAWPKWPRFEKVWLASLSAAITTKVLFESSQFKYTTSSFLSMKTCSEGILKWSDWGSKRSLTRSDLKESVCKTLYHERRKQHKVECRMYLENIKEIDSNVTLLTTKIFFQAFCTPYKHQTRKSKMIKNLPIDFMIDREPEFDSMSLLI